MNEGVLWWEKMCKCYYVVFVGTEYCERYAKKENISNNCTSDEESDEEDISEAESQSSDDEIPGHADP